ncbi:MAG: uncharacterized protein JWO64_32, partial [Hyphomicrobiales bacterium]|nr:uncharacterized protein [Hyphomicrobiales bacterium]
MKPELKASSFVRRFRLIRFAAGAILLTYAFALGFGAKVGFPTSLNTGALFPYLSDQPVGEDGYYLMLVAWNLGAGQGMTANFGETVTGVQPLMTFLLALVSAVIQSLGGDKFDLARAVILLGGLNVLLLATVLARIARSLTGGGQNGETAATIVFICLCLSAYVFRTATYGLETGLYLLLIALTLEATLRATADGRKARTGQAVTIGILVGLTGLARIDFGIVAVLVFGVLLFQRRIDFWRAALAGVLALAIAAPWFLWVHSVSGAYLPSSGPAQSAMVDAASAAGRAEAMLAAVGQNVAPWLPASLGENVAWIGLALVLVGLFLARRRAFPVALRPWWAGFAALPIIYFILFWAAHFYARYTAPLVIVATLASACAAASLPRRLQLRGAEAFVVVALALNAAALWRAFHSGGIGDGHAITAGYVAREIPKDARVGAFQSGVTGFYNANVI